MTTPNRFVTAFATCLILFGTSCRHSQQSAEVSNHPAPSTTEPRPIAHQTKPIDHAAERAAFFDSFKIKGAGGENHIESAAAHGANVIRTWSVKDDGSSMALLDEAHSLGLKVIAGIWMPQPKDAVKHRVEVDWKEDYSTKRQKYLNRIQTLLDLYDHHPALLAWGLGNEVELSPEYLKTVNEMSKAVHAHNPKRHTCTVIVNAPKDSIDIIKTHAPDLDLIGANSYGKGSMFTVANSLEKNWGKPYFFSEYAYHGPWSAQKTASKYPLEFTPENKVIRLKKAYAVMADRPLCAGGVYFLWGHFNNGTRTWFSGLLPKDPTNNAKKQPAYLTPYTDALQECWTETTVDNHAPLIRKATLNGKYGPTLSFSSNAPLTIEVHADDQEHDALTINYWMFKTRVHERKGLVAGPISAPGKTTLAAPKTPGDYVVLVYAVDAKGKASSHQIPFTVR